MTKRKIIKTSFRTRKTQEKYLRLIAGGFLLTGCNLCKHHRLIKGFKYWKIIANRFPYDRIARVSHLIVPKRHTIEKNLTETEKKEFGLIKRGYIEKGYDFLIEDTNKNKSIPEHFHVHLIVLKNRF